MRHIKLFLSALAVATVTQAKEPIIFIGDWSVDFEHTMEFAKISPKYNEQEAERMPSIIKKMMSTMKIRITQEELIYIRRDKEMALPYTVSMNTGDAAILNVKIKENDYAMTFTLLERDFMNFKSSGSDDMDYYIWRRSPEQTE